MFFLGLLRSIISALNSEGRPGQVAAGLALGACLGLTPLLNLHNLVIVLAALILDVSLAGFTLGWTLFVPVGFLLDPLFDAIGTALLSAPSLRGLWTGIVNTPVLALLNLNNSVVLGSLVFWIVMFVPIYVLARHGIARYRATLYERLKRTKFFQAVNASKFYTYYRYFQP
jgi:uncharacterized protein (TIGR03546 family)